MIASPQEIRGGRQTMLVDIKEFTKDWKARMRESAIGRSASLAIIQVGNNEASNRYVRNKMRDAEEIGILTTLYPCPEDISQERMEEIVQDAVNIATGIIIQLPLPPHLDK